ncbi:hypothetical protein K431DRAFT_346944 [Polychaeton citri CBS 116435]|uniref:N-acetyltransferase domain-containing protein n=1 Tax=Polychaeton citri CBS 116435 TaxID=1314669 RepID=A0A9P4Q9N9_9PEZI|nr:hypothetical protein K431DRAFT_346944 [Polychaeton citri CBS 116435]
MTIQFLPLEQADYTNYYRIVAAAFAENGLNPMMFPNGYSDAALKHMVEDLKREDVAYPGRFHRFKVIDTSLPADNVHGQLIGISTWKVFAPERSQADLEREEAKHQADVEKYGLPEGMNGEAVGAYFGEMEEFRKQYFGGKPYVLLALVATHPDHYRKGAGAMHLKKGLEMADELDLPAFLEATPHGAPLYRRHGYKDVKTLDFDGRNWGLDKKHEHVAMLRPRKSERME